MPLATFDPFAEFDRLTQRTWAGTTRPGAAGIRMDAIRRPQEIELRFDLPGIDTDSLDVTVDQGVLSVTAQRTQEFGQDEKPFIRQRYMGSFAHRVRLSDSVDANGIEAAYDSGVLTVRVPLAEKAQPRKVTVAGATTAVEAGAEPETEAAAPAAA